MDKEIIKMERCFKCRMNEELCEGQYALHGSKLVSCPSYVDYRNTKTDLNKVEVMYKKNKKRKKGD